MSAAEMRRLTAQLGQRPAPRPIPNEIEEWWETYAPRFVVDDTWAVIRGEIRAILEASQHRTLEFWKRRCSEVCAYVAWRLETGQSINAKHSMTFEEIDKYFAKGFTGSKNSASTVRSRLRKLAEHVNPSAGTTPGPTFAHNSVKPPYTAEDEARIRRAVVRYREGTLRRKLCLVVGLSCGAGLDAHDFRRLQHEHIIDGGPDGIKVEVPGSKERTVWVRMTYEEVVRAGLDGVTDARTRVIGGRESDRNSVAGIIDNANFLGDVPHIEVARLRSTWLVWAMQRNLPLPVIMEAAGLKGARSLVELVEYVPASQSVVSRGDLR